MLVEALELGEDALDVDSPHNQARTARLGKVEATARGSRTRWGRLHATSAISRMLRAVTCA